MAPFLQQYAKQQAHRKKIQTQTNTNPKPTKDPNQTKKLDSQKIFPMG